MVDTEKLISKLKEMVGEANLIGDPNRLNAYSLDGKVPEGGRFARDPGGGFQNRRLGQPGETGHSSQGERNEDGDGRYSQKVEIVLLTGRLNRITDKDCDNLTLSAEAGITLSEVQETLGKQGKGYFLPLDPPHVEKATLGGIVATNASGPRRFLYGTARDLVIGIKSVFPNGDLVASGGKTVKNVSGYDLGKLLIGSMGTLGILCEMTFKLLPLPEKEATLLVHFDTLEGARDFAHDVIHSQLVSASVEVLNPAASRKLKYPVSLPAGGKYLVAIGLDGVAESIEREASEMGEMGRKRGALGIKTLTDKDHHDFWAALRDLGTGLAEEYPNLICLKSNFVISKWAEMMDTYERITREKGVDCVLTSHAGNGILYSYLLVGKDLASRAGALTEVIRSLTAEAVKNEGNLVVEMSPVSIKEKVDVWGQSRSDYRVVRSLKEEIDPAGILNPGRFVGGI